MAYGVNFPGSNTTYNPPEGVSEDQCKKLHVFRNGKCIVSCWEFTDAEIADIVRTKRLYHSVWSGTTLYPQAIGTERQIHALVADYGKVWRLSEL